MPNKNAKYKNGKRNVNKKGKTRSEKNIIKFHSHFLSNLSHFVVEKQRWKVCFLYPVKHG